MRLKFSLLKGFLHAENFQNAFWGRKQVTSMSILFQNGRMGHVGYFKFLKIFHHHDFEKLLSKAVEAFKVWACEGITAGKNFSKCVLRAKKSQKHVKIVSEWLYKLFWTFLKKFILG